MSTPSELIRELADTHGSGYTVGRRRRQRRDLEKETIGKVDAALK